MRFVNVGIVLHAFSVLYLEYSKNVNSVLRLSQGNMFDLHDNNLHKSFKEFFKVSRSVHGKQ